MGKRNQYTNAEKLAIARKASIPGCSIAFVACAEGLPQSTVRGFMKNIKKLEAKSTSENNLKVIHKDKPPILTKALRKEGFYKCKKVGKLKIKLLSELDRQLWMRS